MSYRVTQADILSVKADAAVICIENTMAVSEDPVSQRLGEAGGTELRSVSVRPYVEPCYYVEADPSMEPRTPEEIARLRAIYEGG